MLDAVTPYRPEMTQAGLSPTHSVTVMDEYGGRRNADIAGERPLTLYLDKREIVTLMTLGCYPEALAIGYLRNQDFIEDIRQIKTVQVDWDIEAVAVTTHRGNAGESPRLDKRTVTTGCGQGTLFGEIMEKLENVQLTQQTFRQSLIYDLLHNITAHNEVYKKAGAVHGCALCHNTEIVCFVEDVGRHNAVDAIAGQMWLEGLTGEDKIFYTTGRLTSEMVIKVAQMGIPLLLSRSGITRMGLEMGQKVGVTMIGRAKGKHFLVFNGADAIELDAVPAQRAGIRGSNGKS
ncbi:MAG: formate dehydrogenase accessory sulfurtransferase FdhD [Candidatus Competibacteraceae bacterium]|jgi:FdhD protein|nr:formate dehydrogenase accessory sulfurtransferase FdhD [Candidatus Competibacteraceae bacterium]